MIKPFPATAPLESAAADILGRLLRTLCRRFFFLGATGPYSELVPTVALTNVISAAVIRAPITHWLLHYVPPLRSCLDSEYQCYGKILLTHLSVLGSGELVHDPLLSAV